jgi:hypothetical protein
LEETPMRRAILSIIYVLSAVTAAAGPRSKAALSAIDEPSTCGSIALARWRATGPAQHSGEAVAWTVQTVGVDSGVADWGGGAELVITQPGEYVISVTTPVNSDCGLYNWSELKINGTVVHSARSLGGQRTLRNLYMLTKVGTSADVVTVGFVTDNDAGGYTQGATITIEKAS